MTTSAPPLDPTLGSSLDPSPDPELRRALRALEARLAALEVRVAHPAPPPPSGRWWWLAEIPMGPHAHAHHRRRARGPARVCADRLLPADAGPAQARARGA